MPYTLSAAARAVGRTKATIQEAIKKGRISAIKDDLGRYQIDPAELHRVYSPAPARWQEPNAASPDQTSRLTDKIEMLERLCRQVEGERDDLREERDHWRRQATAQLTQAPEQPTPTRRLLPSWWPFR